MFASLLVVQEENYFLLNPQNIVADLTGDGLGYYSKSISLSGTAHA